METILDILKILVLVFPGAFRKWEKVEGNIAPEFSYMYYLSIHTEISSYFFLLISSDEVAKVFRHEILISKHWKKRKKCEKLWEVFKYFKHYSCELEAHESRHLVLWIGLHVSQIQIGIRVSHFFGLLYRYISIGLDVHCGHARF